MRHYFSQSVVILDVGRPREHDESPGEQIKLHNGHPLAKPSLANTTGREASREVQFTAAQTKYF